MVTTNTAAIQPNNKNGTTVGTRAKSYFCNPGTRLHLKKSIAGDNEAHGIWKRPPPNLYDK